MWLPLLLPLAALLWPGLVCLPYLTALLWAILSWARAEHGGAGLEHGGSGSGRVGMGWAKGAAMLQHYVGIQLLALYALQLPQLASMGGVRAGADILGLYRFEVGAFCSLEVYNL